MNTTATKPPAFYNQAQPVSTDAGKKGSSGKNHLRSILTVVGLTLFFVVAMLGVMIAQRQRVAQGPVAPNAPQSRPDASETDLAPSPSPCVMQTSITVKGVDVSCDYDEWDIGECGDTENNDCLAGQRYQTRELISGSSA
jgi:hypothetical protein